MVPLWTVNVGRGRRPRTWVSLRSTLRDSEVPGPEWSTRRLPVYLLVLVGRRSRTTGTATLHPTFQEEAHTGTRPDEPYDSGPPSARVDCSGTYGKV